MDNHLLVLAVALSVSWLTSASADTINYDETVSGDLPPAFFGGSPAFIGNFDVGINTVTGQMTSVGDSEFLDWGDSFVFSIPAGLTVTAASAVATHSNCAVVASCDWILQLVNSGIASEGFFEGENFTNLQIFSAAQPLTAGTYQIDAAATLQFASPLPAMEQRQISYSLAFQVEPVPAPPALILLSSALVSLGWLRRKVVDT